MDTEEELKKLSKSPEEDEDDFEQKITEMGLDE
jgi:hypothetical protein